MFLFTNGKHFSLLRIASLPLRETLFVTDMFFPIIHSLNICLVHGTTCKNKWKWLNNVICFWFCWEKKILALLYTLLFVTVNFISSKQIIWKMYNFNLLWNFNQLWTKPLFKLPSCKFRDQQSFICVKSDYNCL